MQANGKKPPSSPPGQATLTFADGNTVTIDYSRPSMRNRKIFGGLVPYDQVWRTGANAATSLKTSVDLNIGGTTVPKGSYTIYTLPGTSKWQLIINKQTGQWGTEYSQGQDLARIPMKVTQRSSGLETVYDFARQDGRRRGHVEAGVGKHHRQRRREGSEVGEAEKQIPRRAEALLVMTMSRA